MRAPDFSARLLLLHVELLCCCLDQVVSKGGEPWSVGHLTVACAGPNNILAL